MAAKTAAFDWSTTPLGPADTWPAALRTSVQLLLNCQLPMYLAWGKDFTQFYNDAYVPILGEKQHDALGNDARVTWSEIWPVIGPMWEQVLQGQGIGFERFKLTIERYGYPEDCYFSFSYSPVPDDDGTPAGVLVTFAETTREVLAEKRQAFQLDLTDTLRNASDPAEIIGQGVAKLGAYVETGRVAYVETSQAAERTLALAIDGRLADDFEQTFMLRHLGPADMGELESGRTLRLMRRGEDGLETWAPPDAGQRGNVLVFPRLQHGVVAGYLLFECPPSRYWSDADVETAEHSARRIWDALDRVEMSANLHDAEKGIRESRDYLRLLINSSEEGFYSVDTSGATIMCNSAFLSMLGFAREEDAIGKKLHDVIHGRHPDGSYYEVCDCPIYKAAAFGVAADVDDELFFRLDGTPFPVEYRARPVGATASCRARCAPSWT